MALFAAGYWFNRDAPASATVGSCMQGQDADGLKVVDCAGGTADWMVIGKIDGVSKAGFDADAEGSICKAYPKTESEFFEGGGRAGAQPVGNVLCLVPFTK